eukprot:11661632-Alexandrium_andersonii.AAC.1
MARWQPALARWQIAGSPGPALAPPSSSSMMGLASSTRTAKARGSPRSTSRAPGRTGLRASTPTPPPCAGPGGSWRPSGLPCTCATLSPACSDALAPRSRPFARWTR